MNRQESIPDSVIEAARNSAYEFFRSPEDKKRAVGLSSKHRGYLGPGGARMHDGAKPDLKESFIWGNQDPALGRKGTELTLHYMKGPYYRFIEIDAGHWLIQDAYVEVSEAILDHLELSTPIVEQQSKKEIY